MTVELFANDYETKLAVPCLSTDVVLTVQDPLPLPLQASGQFRLVLELTVAGVTTREWVIASAGSSSTAVNAVRGQEGSIPLAFPAGTDVRQVVTSGAIANVLANAEAAAIAAAEAAAQAVSLQKAANLGDVASAATARTNLGLGTAATQPSTAFDPAGAATTAQGASLQKASNLSDVANAATARTSLGLGTAATQPSTAFDAAGAATTAQAASLQKASNLSDVASVGTARTSLGLGTAAVTSVSTSNADFQPDGAAAAGATGRTADAGHVHPTDTSRAPLNSPSLTGSPTAPTPTVDDSSTKLATTAYVEGQVSSSSPTMAGAASPGTSSRFARSDHVHPTDTSRAPTVSPAFTGTPTAPTQAAIDNTTKLATTAYADADTAASIGYTSKLNTVANAPDVVITSYWGITAAGQPYWDPAGATTGEAASESVDPTTGAMRLILIAGQR